ncbi:MAG: 16S rRNA (uracil(1498)-N(3))-methyltransferase [Lentisphaerae bacterium]|nr:16S rRNA (uracil(1498)-N(3))-methyltransferase [Lentisphaerota bacterium]
MHRCYLAPERWQDGVLIPDRDEGHHLHHVLRVEPDDVVTLFDGCGRQVQARVAAADAGTVRLEPISAIERLPRTTPTIALLQAVPKGTRMDTIVEKGTELGMARLVPIMTDRTITRLDGAKADKRSERWARIALSAAKQCGVCWIPEIAPVQSLADALTSRPTGDILLVGDLLGEPRPMAEVVDDVMARAPSSISLVIGPEGDLTPAEMASVYRAGAIGISMGPFVLRTDTAALFGLSVLASRVAKRPQRGS